MAVRNGPTTGSRVFAWLRNLVIIIITLFVVIFLGWGAIKAYKWWTSPDEENPAENAEIVRLKKEIGELKAANALLNEQALVRLMILQKWHLRVPENSELEDFDINTYFCTEWCPWLKDELPKVKKDAQKNCDPCNDKRKPPKRITTKKPPRRPKPRRPDDDIPPPPPPDYNPDIVRKPRPINPTPKPPDPDVKKRIIPGPTNNGGEAPRQGTGGSHVYEYEVNQ